MSAPLTQPPAARSHLAPFCEGSRAWLALALALAYVEIYPMRCLHLIGGDATLEPGTEGSSRD